MDEYEKSILLDLIKTYLFSKCLNLSSFSFVEGNTFIDIHFTMDKTINKKEDERDE